MVAIAQCNDVTWHTKKDESDSNVVERRKLCGVIVQ